MVSRRSIDANYFVEALETNGGASSSASNQNKIVRSKKSHLKVNHRNKDVQTDAIEGKNVEKENCRRYHPYQVKKQIDEYTPSSSSSRNRFEKG